MNGRNLSNETDRIAENAYLKLISRVSMVIASAAGIPFALFMLAETYGTLNELKTFQIETKVLLQTIQLQQQTEQGERRDLSNRVRNLEEDNRTLQRVQAEILRILQSSPAFRGIPIEPAPSPDDHP
jgi:hypothetical protein